MQRRLGGRLGTGVLVLAGIIAVGPVFADPIPGDVLIYSNFGPGGSFDTTFGWAIGHFFTVNQVVGQSFTTTSSLQFADAQLAMSGAVGTSAAVYLESDNGGQPGAILDALVEQNPIGMTPGIITFDCRLCVTLSAGTQYWIVAAEGDGETVWYGNNISDNSGLATNFVGSPTGPWTLSGPGTRGAFEVDGFAANIQGGGATLPAPTYRQDFNCFGMPLTNPPNPNSDTYVPPECTGAGYPIDTTKIFRYSGVGSGRGQCMYLTHDRSYNNDASRPITEVDFTGSDAKLSADQINQFTHGGTLGSESSACAGVTIPAQAPIYGPLIMVPSLATPITLAISPDTATALNILPATPAGGTSGLTFSRAGYCKVLTGQITDWSSGDSDFISQNLDATGNPQPFSNTPIPLKVIYRTDGSGTTFLLTQHMTAIQSVCGSSLYTGASQTMPAGLPANFAGANASEGVEAAILGPSHIGNIGYLSPDFTAQSTVMPLRPAVTANLINGAGNVQPPSPSATTAGMGDLAPPSGADRLNQLNWVPLVADPQNGAAYPIVGYTTQEYYTCYSLTSGVNVKANGLTGYLTWALSSPDGVPDQVLNDNGFAPLPPAWKSAVLDTFVNGTDGTTYRSASAQSQASVAAVRSRNCESRIKRDAVREATAETRKGPGSG